MKVFVVLSTMLLSASLLLAQERKSTETPTDRASSNLSLFPSGYLDYDSLTASLHRLAEAQPQSVRLASLAQTSGGRDVWLVTLGRTRPDSQRLPSLLVVANLEADHIVGSQVALALIERLAVGAAQEPELGKLLDRHTIYFVPRLNPDGAERVLKAAVDFRTNLRRMDRDRDGRQNEDGPEDIDGDGLVTRMRARDAKATLIADEKDPRILRKADPAKGQRATFSEYAEGIDNDGDGQINEDPPGGVNLNRNWPHRWTEFDREAGSSPASEPEVRALIQFAFDHPEIAIVWSFGLNDNLRAEPKKPGSTLDDADLPYFAELSREFNKAINSSKKGTDQVVAPGGKEGEPKNQEAGKKGEPTVKQDESGAETRLLAAPERIQTPPAGEQAKGINQSKSPATKGRGGSGRMAGGPPSDAGPTSVSPPPPGDLEPTTDGALSEWAYHQFGTVGLASRLWMSPEIPEPAQEQAKPPSDGEARWLYWNDHVMNGRAYVPFKPFDHPTLGKVEIGGWRPGVRLNPPIESIDAIADAHFSFLKELASKFATLSVADVKVEPKGGRLFQISTVVENTGYLPTALAQGVRTRKAAPVLVRLKTGNAKIVAGRALNRIDSLAGSGGRRELRWLISAPEEVKTIALDVSSPKGGHVLKSIELK